ncbi:hypothetical protein JCM19241_1540 [Vibrio ishigakensis]|uniref:Uncharacterized protein n=1 Tax=Vibrio ishigakensis TaxID=1481914 RepID=A0A0B8QDY6_9VIBR|nr:hypothetical protein JCM19241_1540 [Vibrio ishigakensis]
MKPWFRFIPLILLVTYVITYDVIDQMNHMPHHSQQTEQVASK